MKISNIIKFTNHVSIFVNVTGVCLPFNNFKLLQKRLLTEINLQNVQT